MGNNKQFIVCSVSGSGKTTQVDRTIELCPFPLRKYITTTTREIRPEESGDEYHFLSVDKFNNLVDAGEMIEYSKVYGNWYGLSNLEVLRSTDSHSIGILDVQGAEKFKEMFPEATLIFIMPPDVDELKRRLLERNTNDDLNIDLRIKAIDSEMEFSKKCDHIIKCDSFDNMVDDLLNNVIIPEIETN